MAGAPRRAGGPRGPVLFSYYLSIHCPAVHFDRYALALVLSSIAEEALRAVFAPQG
jgi:hypothetical protein